MDNSTMKLTVTTDDKIGNDSKTFVLNLPFKEKLPNALFDIGLVTDVDGYKKFEVLVVAQEGFMGKPLCGTKLDYNYLSELDEIANELTNYSEHEQFCIEAYMRFYGNRGFWRTTESFDDITVFKCDAEDSLRSYLYQALDKRHHLKDNTLFRLDKYIDWNKVLENFLKDGLGMIYKDHYVFLQPWCMDPDFDPQPRRLAQTLEDWVDGENYPASLCENLLRALPDISFGRLLEMLNNGEPLAPAFLDNDVRHEVFYALACAVGTDIPNKLIEGYEKIWVKPVNNN